MQEEMAMPCKHWTRARARPCLRRNQAREKLPCMKKAKKQQGREPSEPVSKEKSKKDPRSREASRSTKTTKWPRQTELKVETEVERGDSTSLSKQRWSQWRKCWRIEKVETQVDTCLSTYISTLWRSKEEKCKKSKCKSICAFRLRCISRPTKGRNGG